MAERLKVAVLGASGYTGIELLRLLAHPPGAEIAALTADRHAGKSLVEVFPPVQPQRLPTLDRKSSVSGKRVTVRVYTGGRCDNRSTNKQSQTKHRLPKHIK